MSALGPGPAVGAAALVAPLAMAQFVASYAGSNMNVAISAIAEDIGTTVTGVQTTITLFTLTMAAFMIPGSKMTEIWGRKRCFLIGLAIYGVGALVASFTQGLAGLIVGYSLLEGIGSALMIPPIYILITVAFAELEPRAKYFGVVSGAAGLGAAAGPLIGGLITSATSWRVSFWLQVLLVVVVFFLGLRIVDPEPVQAGPRFDVQGAVLSAAGLALVVFGVLQSGTYGWIVSRQDFEVLGYQVLSEGGLSPVWLYLAIGGLVLAWFFRHVRSWETAGREPLLSLSLFRSRTSNLGLSTQCIQWLVMQGTFFVFSVFLQEIWGYNAIQTGLMLSPATAGILLASALASRMARRHTQRRLIRAGFSLTTTGMVVQLLLVRQDSDVWTFLPGVFLIGTGLGIMLTASVNVVQSAFGESEQGDISGLSRSVSNLGSSLGVALAGSILVAAIADGGRAFALATIALAGITVLGLLAAIALPRRGPAAARTASGPAHEL